MKKPLEKAVVTLIIYSEPGESFKEDTDEIILKTLQKLNNGDYTADIEEN